MNSFQGLHEGFPAPGEASVFQGKHKICPFFLNLLVFGKVCLPSTDLLESGPIRIQMRNANRSLFLYALYLEKNCTYPYIHTLDFSLVAM
jgi:hypothetical protein